jgi:hypothetical protein
MGARPGALPGVRGVRFGTCGCAVRGARACMWVIAEVLLENKKCKL